MSNALKGAQNAGKLHSESTKFQIKLVPITHVKPWIHPCNCREFEKRLFQPKSSDREQR